MKKRILTLGIVLVGIMITSCSKGSEMTEEQEGMVAEYIATTILRHNKNSQDKLMLYQKSIGEREQQDEAGEEHNEQSTVSPESTPIPTITVAEETKDQPSDTTDSQQEESNQQKLDYLSKSINEVIGIENLTLEYQSYEITDTYSEVKSDDVNFEAEKNRTFFVVRYKMKNNSEHTVEIDLLSKKIQYVLNLNEKQYGAVISLVDNDMQFMQTTLKSGKEKEGILVFDIPKNLTIKDASLVINNSKKVYEQVIQ